MRDADKPFVCYRQGWSIRIVPRNAAGWRATAGWIVALLVLTGVFVAVLASTPEPGWQIAAVAVFIAATLAWVFGMIRWMLARSEVVDMEDLLRLKRELERERGGRRES